ncbi:MAG: SH3 domain-containing protein [Chitinophagaceae bacterium]|nr:SH3 domain-containing protein [Chitinophagaceae bacterium]
MKFTLLPVVYILSFTLSAKGQLAIIRDPDGFTNVRAGKSTTTKIIGKFLDGDVFSYSYEKNDEWASVYYNPNESNDSGQLQGFIHKDRLLPMEQLKHIPETRNCRTLRDGKLMIHNDSVTLQLTTAPFQARQHVLRKDKDGYVSTIDGRKPVGSDGSMPRQKLTAFRMTIGGNTVDIPAAAWNDIYEPTLETCNVFFDTRTGFMYIFIPSSSDGGGAYTIAWIFAKGRYVKRYVDGF